MGSIPGLGRCPRVENGNLLQDSWLRNSMDSEAWQVTWDRKRLDWATEHKYKIRPRSLEGINGNEEAWSLTLRNCMLSLSLECRDGAPLSFKKRQVIPERERAAVGTGKKLTHVQSAVLSQDWMLASSGGFWNKTCLGSRFPPRKSGLVLSHWYYLAPHLHLVLKCSQAGNLLRIHNWW